MKVLKKHRTKIKFIAYAVFLMMSVLIGRMTYVVVFRGEELTVKATELHERERAIKAGRGRIISSDGTVLATNETVCTVSVIHSQIKDPERVISILSEELDMDEEKVRKYVEKFSSMEKIKSNVPKETGDAIRSYELAGVKVDEDSKRIYPYSELASKILGFTGADNQGILGLEIEYDYVLKGTNGQILTLTDASGVEIEEKEVKIFKEILEWCFCIFLALIIALATRYYIFTSTMVKQTSMYPTLKENQRVLLSRTKRITNGQYKRGDIITFEAPSEVKKGIDVDLSNKVAIYNYEPESVMEKLAYYVLELTKMSYIKRVIAVEGDRVQIANGKVYVNGEELIEEYLPEGTTTKIVYYNDVVVPEGCVFVMGDNRDESMDSRTFGCIPLEKVEGKVLLRYWPITQFGTVK